MALSALTGAVEMASTDTQTAKPMLVILLVKIIFVLVSLLGVGRGEVEK